jgi:uncharacterized protein
MRQLIFLFIGILFGITMYKSEAASWFRIYEMFQFKSFHMYGIIGSALVLGVLMIQLIKRNKIKSAFGETISIPDKEKSFYRYAYGGILFGLGWGLSWSHVYSIRRWFLLYSCCYLFCCFGDMGLWTNR